MGLGIAGAAGPNEELADPLAQLRISAGCPRNLLLCRSTVHVASELAYDVFTPTCNLLQIGDLTGSK